MSRTLIVAGAQTGPVARDETRTQVVRRLIDLMRQAHARGARVVVFPELVLTTFFPRYWMEDQAEVDSWFEQEMPGPETRPLFDEAANLGIGFYLGYAELVRQGDRMRRFNTSILVNAEGRIIGRYRKVHLPGHRDHIPAAPFQHLEKKYFEPGDLGFPVWREFGANMGMCICNDRRWPETYRVMGLQDVEVVLLGYNTPIASGLDQRLFPPDRFPQQAVDAGRRLPEFLLRGRRRQGRHRGRLRHAGRLDHRLAVRRDHRAGGDRAATR